MVPRLIWCALVMILLWAAWRNTSVNRTTGTAPDAMTIGKDLTRADGGELVDVADDQQRGIIRDRLHQAPA